MLDTLAPGRIVFGLLRGTTNEYLSYDLNPAEARERTDEGMELILKAWNEPQPFGWQGRYFQYRTVSLWPRPQLPPAPTYVLGTSAEAGGVRRAASSGPRRVVRQFGIDGPCHRLLPSAMRAVRLVAGTGRHHLARQHDPGRNRRSGGNRLAAPRQAGAVPGARRPARCADRWPTRPATSPARNSRANVGGVLPISFCGGPDRIVEQIRRCREEIGVGVLDISLQDPGTGDMDAMMDALDLFGRTVLPRIRDI